ncbi:MAG: NAD(P)/FAD-dependent oxidoreductase [Dehalococcoidia bacterium]|jgi:phytoene dehydrogenase-like protein
MKGKYEVVIAGGGHNGLIVACYLAKAGLKVCVVEKNDMVGGGVITREVAAPGFKSDLASVVHGVFVSNPLWHRDELGLQSKYGLKYIWPEPQLAIVYPDDKALVFYRDVQKTCQSIAQFSERDAEMYPKYIKNALEVLKMGGTVFFSPPPTFGAMVSMMDSTEMGREYLRVLLSNSHAISEEWFESDQMKIAVSRWATEMMVGPTENGTGVYAYGVPTIHSWGMPYPEGGSGALTQALARCLQDMGGDIRLSSTIKSIKTDGGEAKGVILESGEEILADKAVICNLAIQQVALEMLKPEVLPEGFQTKVQRLKQSSFMGLLQGVAMHEAPNYLAGGDVNKAGMVEFAPSMEDYLRVFDEFKFGIPSTVMPMMVVGTLFDPTRAPQGKHSMYLYHYEPYDLKGGASRWDEIGQEIADGILATLQKHTTNMGANNIIGRWKQTPLDLERTNPAMVKGDLGEIGPMITQFFGNRPLPGWGKYRTPVKKLYMCGSSTHPGGGVTGGGRAAVQLIMEDLGLNFKKVIQKS